MDCAAAAAFTQGRHSVGNLGMGPAMRRARESALAICLLFGVTMALSSQCWGNDASRQPASTTAKAHHHSEAIRVYVMNGLFGEFITNAMNQIGQMLRARGAIVEVGSWMQESSFVSDACAHPGDRIIFVGHSMGAVAAVGAVRASKACGARRVRMVGIDPPNFGSVLPSGVHGVVFVGPLEGPIARAHNVTVTGYGHIGIVNDPKMQQRIVAAALQ